MVRLLPSWTMFTLSLAIDVMPGVIFYFFLSSLASETDGGVVWQCQVESGLDDSKALKRPHLMIIMQGSHLKCLHWHDLQYQLAEVLS